MNKVLHSSKKMDYCTPQSFFNELNDEFHFVLDAAATERTAKCDRYFTPKTDGLSQNWNVGGQCSVILRTVAVLASGLKKLIRKL